MKHFENSIKYNLKMINENAFFFECINKSYFQRKFRFFWILFFFLFLSFFSISLIFNSFSIFPENNKTFKKNWKLFFLNFDLFSNLKISEIILERVIVLLSFTEIYFKINNQAKKYFLSSLKFWSFFCSVLLVWPEWK